jgi:hypothetical protein
MKTKSIKVNKNVTKFNKSHLSDTKALRILIS